VQRVIERTLNLLAFLLTADRPVTADEIRVTVAGYDHESDQAFHRTFERDKDLLRRLGVPLELVPTDAWEVELGYVIPGDDWELADPGLTDDERTAVLLAAQAVRFGGQAAGADALFKLGGARSGGGGEPLAADLGLDTASIEAAFHSVADRRELIFEYTGSLRTIFPYGLVHRRGHWYVVGPEVVDPGVVKAFRLDRAGGPRSGENRGVFERPPGFKASEAIPNAPWEAGADDLEAVVRFDADVAWLAERHLSPDAVSTHLEDGSLEVQMPVSAPGAFLGWIVGFEDRAEIISPPQLRERFLELVRAGS